MAALLFSLPTLHFKKLVLSQLPSPPASCCLISDVDHFLRAAEDVGLPCVTFWTTSASSFLAFQQCQHLVAKGIVPLKGHAWLSSCLYLLHFLDKTNIRFCTHACRR